MNANNCVYFCARADHVANNYGISFGTSVTTHIKLSSHGYKK